VLDRLELADRPPELLAFLRVFERPFTRSFRDAEPLGSDLRSRLVEKLHLLEKARTSVSDEVLFGDADVVEDELGRVVRPDAEFAGDFVGFEAVAVGFDEDLREAVVAPFGVRVRLAEHDEVVADRAVRNPHLVAVNHPLVAVLFGPRRDSGDVTARVWLRDGRAHYRVAGTERRQVFFLLFFGSERGDGLAPERGSEDTTCDTRICGVQLFYHECDIQRAVPCTTVVDRYLCATQPHLGTFLDEVERRFFRPVVLRCDRPYFVFREAANFFSNLFLFVGEREVHDTSPVSDA